MEYASVIASGNSAVVTLPKRWREANGIKVGDKVSIGFPTSTMMTIEPVPEGNSDKASSFLKLRELVRRETAGIRFPQTKEEVRAVLADRDA